MYKLDDGLLFHNRVYKQSLALKQDLPKNKTADGNESPIDLGEINGGCEILARVRTKVEIASEKVLTIKLHHGDSSTVFEELTTLYSGQGTFDPDKELGRFALPSTVKQYLKVSITTSDDAAKGSIDVLPLYLPR